MQSEAALIGADSRVELHSVTGVYMGIAVVVEPRNTEFDLSFGVYETLKNCVTSELCFIRINNGANGIEHFSHRLVEFRLVGIFNSHLFDYFINIRHEIFLLDLHTRSHNNHTSQRAEKSM